MKKDYTDIVNALKTAVGTPDVEIRKTMMQYIRVSKIPISMRLIISFMFRDVYEIHEFDSLFKNIMHHRNYYNRYTFGHVVLDYNSFIDHLKGISKKSCYKYIDSFFDICFEIRHPGISNPRRDQKKIL